MADRLSSAEGPWPKPGHYGTCAVNRGGSCTCEAPVADPLAEGLTHPNACPTCGHVTIYDSALYEALDAEGAAPRAEGLDDRLRYDPTTGDADFEDAPLSDRLDAIEQIAWSRGFGEGRASARAEGLDDLTKHLHSAIVQVDDRGCGGTHILGLGYCQALASALHARLQDRRKRAAAPHDDYSCWCGNFHLPSPRAEGLDVERVRRAFEAHDAEHRGVGGLHPESCDEWVATEYARLSRPSEEEPRG